MKLSQLKIPPKGSIWKSYYSAKVKVDRVFGRGTPQDPFYVIAINYPDGNEELRYTLRDFHHLYKEDAE